MMKNFAINAVAALILCVSFVCGCDSKKSVTGDKTFAEMDIDDIIVQVNDSKLTKREVLIALELNRRAIGPVGKMDAKSVTEEMELELHSYIPRYITRRLLVDDAKRKKVVSEEYVRDTAEKAILRKAKKAGKTREQYLDSFQAGRELAERSFQDYVWLNEGMATNIPPKFTVTSEFATNFMAAIQLENEKIVESNNMVRARLEKIREDILSGKTSFTNEAEKISISSWDLGERERMEFSNKALRDAAFTLKEGMISPPIKEENEFSLIQVVKIIPAVKNEKGKRVHPERRHVYKLSLPFDDCVMMGPADIKQAYAELRRQSQEQAVGEYVEYLFTNGENRIIWPHGTNLWEKAEVKSDK